MIENAQGPEEKDDEIRNEEQKACTEGLRIKNADVTQATEEKAHGNVRCQPDINDTEEQLKKFSRCVRHTATDTRGDLWVIQEAVQDTRRAHHHAEEEEGQRIEPSRGKLAGQLGKTFRTGHSDQQRQDACRKKRRTLNAKLIATVLVSTPFHACRWTRGIRC